MPFASLGLSPALVDAAAASGFTAPTPVQAAAIPVVLKGQDLLACAQTGSGKTVAFGLALAPTLLGEAEKFAEFGAPVALVIAPTRELALQVSNELQWLYAQTGARIVSCVGGMDPKVERQALNRGCHIVVGTPGRLRDHLERGSLDLTTLKAVVLDEADEMLDMGFHEDLTFILETAPAERRTLMLLVRDARGHVLLARRPETGVWSGMWSLPEARSHDEAREFLRPHALDFDAAEPLPLIEHTFSHYRLHIEPMGWRVAEPAATIDGDAGLRWQPVDRLHEVGLPAPVKKLLGSLTP